jgi:hypothetical protein
MEPFCQPDRLWPAGHRQHQLIITPDRPVIARVCGPDAITYDTRPTHIALCHAGGRSSSDDLQRDLRHQLRPSHATLTVRAAHLVGTLHVPDRHRHDSTVRHRFPLAQEPR